MNNELQQQLSKVLELLTTTAEKGSGFIAEQAPLVARELIAYEFWSRLFWVVFSVSLVIGVIKFFIEISRKEDIDPEPVVLCFIVSFIIVFVFSAVGVSNIDRLIKVSTAPSLVILDYVKGVVK